MPRARRYGCWTRWRPGWPTGRAAPGCPSSWRGPASPTSCCAATSTAGRGDGGHRPGGAAPSGQPGAPPGGRLRPHGLRGPGPDHRVRGQRRRPRATLVGARDVVTLDGGPGGRARRPRRRACCRRSNRWSRSGAEEPADVVTDGYRRVERQFGRIHDAVGEVMTGSATYRQDRPAARLPRRPDGRPGRGRLPRGRRRHAPPRPRGTPTTSGRSVPGGVRPRPSTAGSRPPGGPAPFEPPSRPVARRRPRPARVTAVSCRCRSSSAGAPPPCARRRSPSTAYAGSTAVPDGGRLLVAVPVHPGARRPDHGGRRWRPAPRGRARRDRRGRAARRRRPGRTLDVPRPVGAEHHRAARRRGPAAGLRRHRLRPALRGRPRSGAASGTASTGGSRGRGRAPGTSPAPWSPTPARPQRRCSVRSTQRTPSVTAGLGLRRRSRPSPGCSPSTAWPGRRGSPTRATTRRP